jgi:hypothetical protein
MRPTFPYDFGHQMWPDGLQVAKIVVQVEAFHAELDGRKGKPQPSLFSPLEMLQPSICCFLHLCLSPWQRD